MWIFERLSIPFRIRCVVLALLAVANHVKGMIDEFKPNLPLIIALAHSGMALRHWNDLEEKVLLTINN
jgi:hypothetical protein